MKSAAKPPVGGLPTHEKNVKLHTELSGTHLPLDASSSRIFVEDLLRRSENGMGLVIVVNFVIIIMETDKIAKDDEDPPAWLNIVSWSLLICFIVELVLKLFARRLAFWHDHWNTFDFIVITVDTVMSMLSLIVGELFSVSALRILRLSRLARAAKMLRIFPELRLMLAGLTGALHAIFWGTLLLFVVMLTWAVIAVQFIHPLNKYIHEQNPEIYGDCRRCARAYESTFQALLTFWTQIVAGDSWARETVPVIEAYPAAAILFIGVFLSVGLAVLNLILGVVVNVATAEREKMQQEMAEEHDMFRLQSHNVLLQMCEDMDTDGNEVLTYEEIRRGYDHNEGFRDTLIDMNIEKEDIDIVWTILDSDKSGTITTREFVSQVYKMKSSDTQFMLAYIKFYVTEIRNKLSDDIKLIQTKIDQDVKKMITEEEMRLETDIQVASSEIKTEVKLGFDAIGVNTEMKLQNALNKDVQDGKLNSCADPMRSQDLGVAKEIENGKDADDYYKEMPQDVQCAWSKDVGVVKQVFDKEVTEASVQPGVMDEGKPIQGMLFGIYGNGELSNVQLDMKSLEVLFQDLPTFAEFEHELARVSSSPASDHTEVLKQLHGVWQQCLVSVNDMKKRHSSLSELVASQVKHLETMIRRVNDSISETVSVSVRLSAASSLQRVEDEERLRLLPKENKAAETYTAGLMPAVISAI